MCASSPPGCARSRGVCAMCVMTEAGVGGVGGEDTERKADYARRDRAAATRAWSRALTAAHSPSSAAAVYLARILQTPVPSGPSGSSSSLARSPRQQHRRHGQQHGVQRRRQ